MASGLKQNDEDKITFLALVLIKRLFCVSTKIRSRGVTGELTYYHLWLVHNLTQFPYENSGNRRDCHLIRKYRRKAHWLWEETERPIGFEFWSRVTLHKLKWVCGWYSIRNKYYSVLIHFLTHFRVLCFLPHHHLPSTWHIVLRSIFVFWTWRIPLPVMPFLFFSPLLLISLLRQQHVHSILYLHRLRSESKSWCLICYSVVVGLYLCVVGTRQSSCSFE